MWLNSIPVIGKLLKGVVDLVDEAVEDKDEANRLKADLTRVFHQADLTKFITLIQSQAQIVAGEVTGTSWLQRNWRPLLMLLIMIIVANNYLVYPYLVLFTDKAQILKLPGELWNLMTIGVGGYVVGRSVEKSIKASKNSD